ncbi:tetratricopeptide repeat protein [Aureitalea sp. L0-47]|uniref:tetratricopeptide repeat protein n=1 Tax=Aureitalea sp. L0-47 TaxID=2816962 RepID=UPI0022376E01|nr:tetratricopeptide repeat protein [Aureitalea sp. L0-47]MCW5518628.1 tetratricopeptide repeat protein [Aureitalea sp. L0-47]
MSNSEQISQEFWERCERYLNQAMKTSEKSEFEAQLKSDPEFKSKFEEVESSILGIESAVLKSKLDDFHSDLSPVRPLNPPGKKKFKPWTWSVAAVLVIALGIFALLNTGNQNEKLFAKHFTPDPGLPTTMSSSINYEFFEGMVDYKKGDYNLAIQKWESLVNEVSVANDTLNYFIGVAYLAEEDESRAITHLEEVLKTEESVFQQDCSYYLGLAYLKQDEVETAVKYFRRSDNEASKAILSELND